jgi:HD-GYP domain-containing protein (c-di-GMP phosphodiesterase class II)
MVQAFTVATEQRDSYTQGHHERVMKYALMIYDCVFGSEETEERKALINGCRLHDIGKICVPDHILQKPGPLTPEERLEIEKHPGFGFEICKNLKTLLPLLPIIKHHHEKQDGSGYPDKLEDGQIPAIVEITTIADIFDALTSDRSYRKKNTTAEALTILIDMADNKKLNHYYTDIFKKLIEEKPGEFPS